MIEEGDMAASRTDLSAHVASTTATELQSLLDRVLAATGPDTGLDRDVAEALSWRHRSGAEWDRILAWERPAFTASLDAALALVERVLPGWVWMLDGGPKGSTAVLLPPDDEDGSAPTARQLKPPLALLAALLRALIAQQDNAHD